MSTAILDSEKLGYLDCAGGRITDNEIITFISDSRKHIKGDPRIDRVHYIAGYLACLLRNGESEKNLKEKYHCSQDMLAFAKAIVIRFGMKEERR